ncbi:MAG: peptidoglycan editing factor PgeF [Acidobacteriota bacterium]|nr:peptidoglycan editing factor PgeF [Acidobacteriota bacterium]
MIEHSFLHKRAHGLEWLAGPQLAALPWLVHGFSTRRGGFSRAPAAGLNLGHSEEPSQSILSNRRAFFKALGAEQFALGSIHQIHSAEIFEVKKMPEMQFLPAGYPAPDTGRHGRVCGDAMVAHDAGILLGIRTADCLPILLADPCLRVVAAIHAGWRGALKRITEKTVGEMRRIYGSDPRRLIAALGPSIRSCCYEVGDEVVDAFAGQFVRSANYFRKVSASVGAEMKPAFLSVDPPGHARATGSGFSLDLAAVTLDQLLSAGVAASRIQTAGFCTSCRTDLFFSYRREGDRTGRMMAVIGIRK